MVASVKPSMVGMAKAVEFADVDHEADLAPPETQSSVIVVTAAAGPNA
jgi:hypothetical protein